MKTKYVLLALLLLIVTLGCQKSPNVSKTTTSTTTIAGGKDLPGVRLMGLPISTQVHQPYLTFMLPVKLPSA